MLKILFATEYTSLMDYVRQDVHAGIVGYLSDSQKLALAASTHVAALYGTTGFQPEKYPAGCTTGCAREIGLIHALVLSFHRVKFSLEILSLSASCVTRLTIIIFIFFI